MNPTLRNVATILPALLRNAIPKPSGSGYVLELEGAELDALRELSEYLLRWQAHERLHRVPQTELDENALHS